MAFADHFSSVAAGYAEYRPHYPPALVEILADHALRHELAWDAGCGNGQLSLPLAERFERVVATDPAEAQLAAAPRHPRVDYRRAPAEATDLAADSVDLAVAAQAAHWFDWPRYVAEVARVTRPGAVVALVSYGIVAVDRTAPPFGGASVRGKAPNVEGEAGPLVAHYYHHVVAPFWPAGRHHVENGYRDLVWPWPELPAPAVAMQAAWTRDELLGYIATWSATAKMVATNGRGEFEALAERLAAVWPDRTVRDVRWPLTVRLARRP